VRGGPLTPCPFYFRGRRQGWWNRNFRQLAAHSAGFPYWTLYLLRPALPGSVLVLGADPLRVPTLFSWRDRYHEDIPGFFAIDSALPVHPSGVRAPAENRIQILRNPCQSDGNGSIAVRFCACPAHFVTFASFESPLSARGRTLRSYLEAYTKTFFASIGVGGVGVWWLGVGVFVFGGWVWVFGLGGGWGVGWGGVFGVGVGAPLQATSHPG